jgi:hypothetical protein
MPDLFDFLGRHMDQAKKDVLATGEIADLEIEGDTATAMSGDQKVRFGKVGDRWYVRMEE